jgi:hypothetical protein
MPFELLLSLLDTLEDLNLVAGLKSNNGLFPGAADFRPSPDSPFFTSHHHDIYPGNRDLESLFNRQLDLSFVGFLANFKTILILALQNGVFFRHQGPSQYFK